MGMPNSIGKRQEQKLALLNFIDKLGGSTGAWAAIRLDDFRPYVPRLKFASSISYALQRLEKDGLIQIGRDRRAGMDRLPNSYKLTQAGWEAIKQ